MVLRKPRCESSALGLFQKELFNIDNGGELFFGAVDALLQRDETLPLIFESFSSAFKTAFEVPILMQRAAWMIRRTTRVRVLKLDHRQCLKRRRRRSSDQDGIELIDCMALLRQGAGAALGIFMTLYLVSCLNTSEA